MLKVVASVLLCGCLTASLAGQSDEVASDYSLVVDQIARIVQRHFLDADLVEYQWERRVAQIRPAAVKSRSTDEFAATINRLLATLETSHTRYFSRLEPRRYQLLGIMHEQFDANDDDLFIYDGIGMETRSFQDRILVSAVYDGLPADRAGVKFGDQILTVDQQPFHPVTSFAGKAGRASKMQILRRGQPMEIDVKVARLDGRTMFRDALQSSARVIDRNGFQTAYLHVWSYAGPHYQEQVRSQLLWGPLRNCDGLVLDLRDGWGGADLNYLNLFRSPIAQVESKFRNEPNRNFSGVWGKPVALLVNGGTTSGKELFAYGFRKLRLGKIIGEQTAGAVVAGRCFLLRNRDLLYLAVADITIDGQRLEGVGIRPDVVVPRPIDAPTEVDPQLERAVEWLMETARK